MANVPDCIRIIHKDGRIVVVPKSLWDNGLCKDADWKIYLPVATVSKVPIVPVIPKRPPVIGPVKPVRPPKPPQPAKPVVIAKPERRK